MTHVRLGELLMAAGLLTQDKLAFALREQRRTGARLGQILVDARLVAETDMVDALAKTSGLSRLEIRAVDINIRQARDAYDRDSAAARGAVPLAKTADGHAFTVALTDPTNVGALDEISFRTGLKVNPILGTPAEIDHLIHHIYDGQPFDPNFSSRQRVDDHPMQGPAGEILHDNLEVMMAVQNNSATQSGPVPRGPLVDGETPSLSDVFGPLLALQDTAARELEALYELCVEKGHLSAAEWVARFAQASDDPIDA